MTVTHVPVRGGELAVELMPGTSEPVLAVHGISSHRRLWDWLRAEAPELTLLAPDLRGRADSVGVLGPSSVEQHVEDLIAVLDAHGLGAVHVCGMSMGGFIAVELAVRHPERVKNLVLVDGGFPFAVPDGLTLEALPVVFADRLGRLEHAWSSVEELAAFFTAGTGPLLDAADPTLLGYLAHDLDADGRVRLSGPVLLDDAASIFFGDNHWQQLTVPVRLLVAEWGTGADSAPAYPAEAIERYAPATVRTVVVPGVDHAGSIMSKAGAATTAELLSEALT
ncbi:MAG: Beta-ketoadipate enol-lactone hydrolase [Frankiales bacterium]|nr:Beta-ketoadipate enol-lactone hydrolase [Frankiales bacterium]